ncbi:MAG: T9SS type A sorting domain-containing protein [Candidatus Limimorpha sp.]
MKKLLLFISCCLMGVLANAQISLEHSFEGYPVFYDGKYLIFDNVSKTLNIYNLDYSLYKMVNISVPDGYSLSISVSFPSKHLFNSDDKMEFLITAYNFASISGILLVLNEDGDVVHTISDDNKALFPHSIVENNGDFKLIVYGLDSQQKYHTCVYSLPGTYESVDSDNADVNSLCYPNPAKDFVRLHYTMKKGATGVLKVFDANGVLVDEKSVGSDFDEIILDVSNYPSGIYIYECNGNTNRFIKQ